MMFSPWREGPLADSYVRKVGTRSRASVARHVRDLPYHRGEASVFRTSTSELKHCVWTLTCLGV